MLKKVIYIKLEDKHVILKVRIKPEKLQIVFNLFHHKVPLDEWFLGCCKKKRYHRAMSLKNIATLPILIPS